MHFNANEFNALFSDSLTRGGDSLEKVAEVTGTYIQERLRENGFARKILAPQVVTTAELTRSEDDEGWKYIDDLEPDSIAMRINMRGEPDKEYFQGRRYSIKFGMISSKEFTKAVDELRTYRMPLTKIIEQNMIKDIQEQEDLIFMDHVRTAVILGTRHRMNELSARGETNVAVLATNTAAGVGVNGKNFASAPMVASYVFTSHAHGNTNGGALVDGADRATVNFDRSFGAAGKRATGYFSNLLCSAKTTFDRDVLVEAVKVQAAREMKARCFLLHEYDWADVMAWVDTEAGLELTSEIVRDGYKYATVGGLVFVTTVRDNQDLIRQGQLYTFPAPEMLGRFLMLDGIQFYIDKRGRFLTMQAWEQLGMGFGNIRGIGLNLLTGSSVKLPTIWQTDAGANIGTPGSFTLFNDLTTVVGTKPVATTVP